MANDAVNIVMASDSKWLSKCFATIMSVLENTDRKVRLQLLTEPNSYIDPFVHIQNEQFEFKYIPVTDSKFDHMPVNRQYVNDISKATYWRMDIPQYIHDDKVLYLDSDILCTGDVGPLFDTDLSGNVVGAVIDAVSSESDMWPNFFGVYRPYRFNAGVLLIDVPKFRNDIDKAILLTEHEYMYEQDQTILNMLYWNEFTILDDKYNMHDNKCWLGNEPMRTDTVLVHFVSSPKPWSLDQSQVMTKTCFDKYNSYLQSAESQFS